MDDERYEPFPPVQAWTSVPFDPGTYDEYAGLLEQARGEASEEVTAYATRMAVRYAGTDTGAIEGLYTTDRGFTRTVAIEAAHWEAAASERGPNAVELIKDQIAAYEWLLDLVTQRRPITESIIRELHATLCRSQDVYVVHTDFGTQERPLPKGRYKEFPNNPTSLTTGRTHHYAPPEMVGSEVHRLVESLSAPDYVNAHPVVQAAYLHYSFVAIHPFADGNGRTTRALASVPLYRDVRVPLIVFRDQRDEYLDALGAADGGDLAPFVAFVQERVLDAIDLVRNNIRVARARDRDKSLSAIQDAQRIGGLAPQELEAIAGRVRDELVTALKAHMKELSRDGAVVGSADTGRAGPRQLAPPGYRWPPRDLAATLRVTSAPPARAHVPLTVTVAVAQDHAVAPIAVTAQRDDVPLLELGTRDVSPQLRDVARIKIADWSELVIDAALRDLVAAIAAPETTEPQE